MIIYQTQTEKKKKILMYFRFSYREGDFAHTTLAFS